MLEDEITLLKVLSEKPRVVCGDVADAALELKKKGFVSLEEREAGVYACAITDQGVAALAAVSLG